MVRLRANIYCSWSSIPLTPASAVSRAAASRLQALVRLLTHSAWRGKMNEANNSTRRDRLAWFLIPTHFHAALIMRCFGFRRAYSDSPSCGLHTAMFQSTPSLFHFNFTSILFRNITLHSEAPALLASFCNDLLGVSTKIATISFAWFAHDLL